MKKRLATLFTLLNIGLIFSYENTLTISDQSIEISYYSESEYNQEFGTSKTFSGGFDILSNTDDVTVYVNEVEYESDELYLYNFEAGDYLVRMNKTGFKPIKKWIELDSDQRIVIEFSLTQYYGFLDVEANTPNLELLLDDIAIENGKAIPIGSYILTIKSFGYTSKTMDIEILNDTTTKVGIELDIAPFEVKGFLADKKRYNPSAKEGFGVNNIIIEVNGPGSGVLSINNDLGFTKILKNMTFDTWDYHYILDEELEDGIYTLSIYAEGEKKTLDIVVDNALNISNIPITNGFPGLIAVATAEYNTIAVSTTSFSVNTSFNENTVTIPFSYQKTIIKHLDIRGGMEFLVDIDGDFSEVKLFTGLKGAGSLGILLGAINGNYYYSNIQSSSGDNSYSHNVAFNTPITLSLSPFYLTITPQYEYNITDSQQLLGGGIGLHFDNQKIRIGLSGRADIDEDDEISVLYGAESYYLLSNSQSYLGLLFYSDEDLNSNLALNLSILF